MPTPWLIVLKAADGGLFVALFAVLGEMLQPKRFAGIFGASPAVSLANLLISGLVKGDGPTRDAATGMIAGVIALVVGCAAAIPAVRRWGSLRGSAVLWGVWMAVGAAVAVPIAGGAAAGAGTRTGRLGQLRSRGARGSGARGSKQNGGGSDDHRLFGIDTGTLREIRPRELALRFAFGAAVSVVAGLIGIAAGQRAGGVFLAAPAVLPATLTIIEKEEGRGPAVTEVQGSVMGALALVGFALVAAASLARIPLAAALISALATWTVLSVGGYLAQAALLPSWQRDVRDIARRRRETTLARRAQAATGPR